MSPQLTTQMAPVAPLPFSLADRDIQVRFFFIVFYFTKFLLIDFKFILSLHDVSVGDCGCIQGGAWEP